MNLFTPKFQYQASESAPQKNVMRIVAGSLNYDGGSLSIPNGSSLDNGWGSGASSQIVGPDRKPLPKYLGILFFSYTENQFYRGRFDLPYDKIFKLFKEGHYSPKKNKDITYDTLVVGVAPGGAVAVWAESLDKTTEVFFGQAEKVEEDWSLINTNPNITRDEYIARRIKESLETAQAIAALHKNGPPIGLWSRYRTRYLWQPVFSEIALRDGRISFIKYFNGERDYIDYPLDKANVNTTRAVPSELHFIWAQTKDKGRLIELYFNEAEIFDTFKRLGSNNTPLTLEMRIDTVGGKSTFHIYLRNDKESIELKHTEVKNYGA